MKNQTLNNNTSTMSTELTIENFERTMNLLESTGLNWEVKKEQFVHPSGLITDHYGVFKYNPGENTPVGCLGSVKGRYTPFQNWELADTVVRATESIGIQTNRGGQFHGGRKVYLQAQLGDEFVGKSGVKRWVTCVNSHDGSSSIAFGSTNTVIVCQNTFYRAYKETQRFRHTATAKARIELAIEQFQETIQADKNLFDSFKRMSETAPKENLVQAVLKSMFEVDTAKTSADDISTRKMNQMRQFAHAYNIERDLEGDTVWGLFNAVTRYTNHMAAPSNAESKSNYIMNGGGYDINNAAYDVIMSWIDENTASKIYSFA
jgi:phage/plasmid-like protein (TIGR03299 family)